MTPAIVEPLANRIPGAEWVIFEKSSHAAAAEEPDRYRRTLAAFLDRVDRSAPQPR